MGNTRERILAGLFFIYSMGEDSQEIRNHQFRFRCFMSLGGQNPTGPAGSVDRICNLPGP
jgi:hypothetical protein